ncbi:MAG: hypothetical protein GY750_06270 [Lentisphaerae bacterium]|nr:hypothetical protein [Lentisphaerota bacterium]MCP4101013.1 hypothetical protein [Lentisphaerota bacterium]
MPFPVATLASMSATGAPAIGTCVTCIRMGLPAADMGDPVTGPLCIGAITAVTTSINKIRLGRPVATMTSVVTGSNPALFGAPTVEVIAMSPAITIIR